MVLILGGLYLNNWILVIFGFFMGFRVRAMQKNYLIHKELNKKNISYLSSYKNLSNKNYIQIKEVLLEQSTALKKIKDMMPEDEIDPVIAEQVNGVLVTPMDYDASLFLKIILLFIWTLSISLIVVLPLLFLTNSLWVDYFDWYFNEISFK